ncbi:MAG: ACT domain-containing protein, partial [Congregibacter sp.]|nr:ACT domain-containing protein [Congregibacter sp.]
NAVRLQGHAAGETVYTGAGAGRLPTASAIVADLIDIARAHGRPLHCLGVPVASLKVKPIVPMASVCSAWYLRLQAEDRPGVMSQLASCLSAEGISIEALIQKAPKRSVATVSVVVLTNDAREDALRRAVSAIAALPAVTQDPHCIRVESPK